MSDIVKHQKKELTTVDQEVSESEYKKLRVGAIFISADGKCIRKITKLEVEERKNWDKTREKAKEADGHYSDGQFAVFDEVLKIYFVEDKDWEADTWEDRERSEWIDSFDSYSKGFIQLEDGKTVKEYTEEAEKVIKGEKRLEEYQDTSMNSSGTDLISLGSKEHLQAMSEGLVESQNKAQLIRNFVARSLERQKQELDRIKDELGIIVKDFQNKVEKINKVIHTIELYLGINEDIIQFQKGEKAPVDSPICFRQEVLYMDEEMGDPRTDGKGLDFREIEAFDDWLCERENYKLIIPEDKGITVLRVRREKKQYDSNPFVNFMMNKDNMKTYIFIRNGENLYRIWADINITRLFPRKTELMDLQDEATKAGENYVDKTYGKSKKQEASKEVEDVYLRYQKQIILLQGLIDRTEIFTPLAAPIKLTDPAIHDTDLVRFIYDDETKIGDGRQLWRDFLKKTNENIGIGSRVVFVHVPRQTADDRSYRYDSRYNRGWRNSDSAYGLPDKPKSGIYQVEASKHTWSERVKTEDGKHYEYKSVTGLVPCVKYNPEDEIRNNWDYWDDGHTRKNRISWRIHLDDDWDWMIDIDNISIEDIDYYLDAREHRRHYLHMMPMLWEIRKFLVKEKEAEKDFVQMMAGILLNEHAKKKNLEEIAEMVWEAVVWWKTKNKWKRALDKDNAKALRMIVNRLKNKV